MKKTFMYFIGIIIILFSYIYCWPYSNSSTEIHGFVKISSIGIFINYCPYFLALYLSNKKLLVKVISKTNGLILAVPYVLIFFNVLMFITYMIALIATNVFSLSGIVMPVIVSIDCAVRIKKLVKLNEV